MSFAPIGQTTQGHTFQAIFPGRSQAVAIGASSTNSSALIANTNLIKIFPTVDCFIAIGLNPTAVSNTTMFCPGGIEAYYGISVSQSLVAVIQSSASGTLYITEGA